MKGTSGEMTPSPADRPETGRRGRESPPGAGGRADEASPRRSQGSGTSGGSGSRGRGRTAALGPPNLERDLREFASARPGGWEHEDWLAFLESLQGRGHDIRDRDAIGTALEKARVDLALSGIKGVGEQRRQALIRRFPTIWSLRSADGEEIARAGNLPRTLADRIKEELR